MAPCLDASAARAFVESGERGSSIDFLPRICAEIATLTEQALDPRERLSVLEELRPGLWRVLAEFEREHLPRALPFSESENRRWHSYIEAWSLMLGAYMHSLAEADHGESGLLGLVPLLQQRVVRQAVQVAIASYRAYMPGEPGLWTLLHEHLRRAEETGTLDLQVADPTVAMDGRSTLAEAYLHLALLDFCDPYALRPHELVLASRWLERLAHFARISQEVVPHGGVGFVVVDLDHGAGLRLLATAPDPSVGESGSPRYIRLATVHEQVKRLLTKLRLGISPGDLLLGEDCTREEADLLLDRVHRRLLISQRRRHRRRPANEHIQVALGLTAVHRYLNLRPEGLEPDEGADSPHAMAADDDDVLTTPLLVLAHSQIVDQSPSGIGLIQSPGGSSRLRCQQLVALIGRREVLLGSVRWLAMDSEVGLRFGVRVIPGCPDPVRLLSSSTVSGEYDRAILLPGLPSLDEPATLVTAPGVFWPGRDLQLWVGPESLAPQIVTLQRQLEVGVDFERVTFTLEED